MGPTTSCTEFSVRTRSLAETLGFKKLLGDWGMDCSLRTTEDHARSAFSDRSDFGRGSSARLRLKST